MNQVTLSGNLTKEPELRPTQSGKAVVKFSIAVNRRTKVDGEWTDELEGFFNVEAWDKMAEAFAHLPKGERVTIVGKLKQDTWQTEDGQKRSAVKVVAEDGGVSLRWGNKAQVAASGGFDEGGF